MGAGFLLLRLCGEQKMSLMTENTPTTRLMRRRAVEDATGLPRSTIYEMLPTGKFPRPFPYEGKRVAWLASEVNSYIASKVAIRDNPRLKKEVDAFIAAKIKAGENPWAGQKIDAFIASKLATKPGRAAQ
jgi:prophage regulatory protein